MDNPNTSNRLPIGVVVLHFGDLRNTFDCLHLLRLSDPCPQRLVVINNSLEPIDRIALTAHTKTYSSVQVENPGQNLGYAAGMNLGIRILLADYTLKVILLLNNDTLVRSDFLAPLFTVLQKNDGYQLTTPKILYANSNEIWSTGERVCYPFLWARPISMKFDRIDFKRFQNINAVTGCAMAVRREVFEKIGLLDENYFAYVEDVDFCFRAHRSGFRFAYCPQSIVYHKASSSLGDFSPAKVYLNVRNKAYFIKKNIPHTLWPLSWGWYFATVLSWVARALVEGKPDVIRSIILAFRDVVNRRMGAPPWVK